MLTRRGFLATGAGAALIAARPSRALAQTPKRGGTLTIRAWDPPHFDASLVHAYKTHVAISFTHSRLLRHRAGEGVKPGSLMIEGDLAESWTQPSDTTYVFKLRRGVRFHAKPPVNARELTAEDVKFTFECMLTEAGRPRAGSGSSTPRCSGRSLPFSTRTTSSSGSTTPGSRATAAT
jgi:ABC-type transport system substrate-binding protein